MSNSAGRASLRWAWLLGSLLGCSNPPDEETISGAQASGSNAVFSAPTSTPSPNCASPDTCASATPPIATQCAAPIPIYEKGAIAGSVCPDDASAHGLTIVSLRDDWAPRVFSGDDVVGPAPYRERYVRIANEDFGRDPTWDRELKDRYFELYGIFPSFTVLSKRLNDDERHACHAALQSDGLAALKESVDTWKPRDKQREERLYTRQLKRRLDSVSKQLKLSMDELAAKPRWAKQVDVYRRFSTREQAIRDMQNRLRCDELLIERTAEAGILDNATIEAMQAYMRRHMIVTWRLDEEMRDTLLTDSRELDYRQVLRALRERVGDASGLIEDGSAAAAPEMVMGRYIDARVFRAVHFDGSMPNGAEDLLARATDAAAHALGWTEPATTAKALAAGLPERVAIRLPAVPDYHSADMDLYAEIDRGDMVYDVPFDRDNESPQRERLPALVLYTRHQGKKIALLRYPTTVGGWQPEWMPEYKRVMLTYKESPSGPRIWRDLIAEPRWIPPESTPERDLVRPRGEDEWVPRLDTFGPSYASAYGMVMLMHHRVDGNKLVDQGIRTHGSVSYGSIFEGYSHGCHRLHNHRMVRLASFILAHRKYVVHGPIPVGYVRTFDYQGKEIRLQIDSRGFRYELDPPIQVEVLPGRTLGSAPATFKPKKLPDHMKSRYRFD
ncbi:MAG: hypothetical protein HOW73_18520 [Polyangiaceae bacterium]|nr:hypothetical protein [Polyangiaceae bacterium]